MSRTPSTFQTLTQSLQIQAKIASDIETLRGIDPRAAEVLVTNLYSLVGGMAALGPRLIDRLASVPTDGSAEKVMRVFASNGNRPLKKPEIIAAAGISAGSLHTVLYTSHPTMFLKVAGDGRGKSISLTPEAYADARSA